MKKVILLILSVFLIVVLAVPAMADVSWSGRLLSTYVTAFAPKDGKATSRYYYAQIDMKSEIDEYNTANAGFTIDANPYHDAYWRLNGLYVDTDVGAYFGMPVGVVARYGVYWACTRKYEVSFRATERVGRQCALMSGLQGELDFGMGTVTVGTSIGEGYFEVAGTGMTFPAAADDPDTPADETVASNPVMYAIVTLPELGPVDLEAFLYGKGQEDFKPVLGVNAKVVFEPVSVAAGFAYDMAADEADPLPKHLGGHDYELGVGASASFGMLTVGAAMNGNNDDFLNFVNLEAGAELMENVGVDVGVGLSFAEDADAFQGAEISAYLKPGASCWRIGYAITTTGYSHAATTMLDDGGLFVQGDLSF